MDEGVTARRDERVVVNAVAVNAVVIVIVVVVVVVLPVMTSDGDEDALIVEGTGGEGFVVGPRVDGIGSGVE